jgi:hypothetical protein
MHNFSIGIETAGIDTTRGSTPAGLMHATADVRLSASRQPIDAALLDMQPAVQPPGAVPSSAHRALTHRVIEQAIYFAARAIVGRPVRENSGEHLTLLDCFDSNEEALAAMKIGNQRSVVAAEGPEISRKLAAARQVLEENQTEFSYYECVGVMRHREVGACEEVVADAMVRQSGKLQPHQRLTRYWDRVHNHVAAKLEGGFKAVMDPTGKGASAVAYRDSGMKEAKRNWIVEPNKDVSVRLDNGPFFQQEIERGRTATAARLSDRIDAAEKQLQNRRASSVVEMHEAQPTVGKEFAAEVKEALRKPPSKAKAQVFGMFGKISTRAEKRYQKLPTDAAMRNLHAAIEGLRLMGVRDPSAIEAAVPRVLAGLERFGDPPSGAAGARG